MSNAAVIERRWAEFLNRVNRRWPQLTDDDLATLDSGVDVFVGRIREKTGERRETIEKVLGDLSSRGSADVSSGTAPLRERPRPARFESNGAHRGALEDQGESVAGSEQEMSEGQACQSPATASNPKFGFGLLVGLVVGLAVRCCSAVQDV